jgi:hypothetical protein
MNNGQSIVMEVAGILDRHDRFSFLPGNRSRLIFEMCRLMLNEDKVALLRAAVTEPAELIDIVEMTTGGI